MVAPMSVIAARFLPIITTFIAWGTVLFAELVRAAEVPSTYAIDYPPAQQFVPPIEGFFEEVSSNVGRVGRRTFRHQPNGGYGLPVQDRIGAQNLIHLGADVGWYRVRDPVVAVTDGIVRLAQQPVKSDKKKAKSSEAEPKILHWGGVVAIEHRLAEGRYVTTVYGHLDTKLLVSPGDIVKAGQPIGTIGATRVNGGYKPHLHFGVRTGRMAKKGRKLLPLNMNGQPIVLTIEAIADDHLQIGGAESLPDRLKLTIHEKTFEIERREGVARIPSEVLYHIPPIDFQIVGYGLSTAGWQDPVEFLRNPHGD